MNEEMNTLQRIKYIGGMALCVILSVLILIFGKHDADVMEEVKVDISYEQQDGDLDFGTSDNSGQGETPTPTAVPSATPSLTEDPAQGGEASDKTGSQGSGTEDDPLLIADESFSYRVVNGKATVTEVTDTAVEELIIPEKVDGYPVTVIGEYLCQGFTK